MIKLLKSLPARCWFISLGLFLATLAAAHFFSLRNINGICQVSGFAISDLHHRFFQLLGIQSNC
jgi:hypothetical protein